MRKILYLLCCAMLFVSLSACGTSQSQNNSNKEEVKNDKPKKEAENKTINGKIVDATNSNFEILGDDGKQYVFNRSQMEFEGNALRIDAFIEVTYKEEDGIFIALQGKLIKQASTPENNTKLDTIIEQMSLEEKVGQMFFVRCPKEQDIEDVNTYQLGGYILFDQDVRGKTFQQLVDTLATYQAQANIPLLIGVDEEGGTVNRLSNYTAFRGVPFWAPQDLYNAGGFDLIRSDTKEKAQLLKSIGINVNLAPVADVSTSPNDFIFRRSFGKDALQTSEYVRVVVKEMKENNIGSTLKHFPGYGNNVDTHTGISIDKRNYESFELSDFLPFKAGIEAGVDSILVSHNIMSVIDETMPSSLSKKVHDILRKELNFQGVIMTDDLAMDAISQYHDAKTIAVEAVKAGNDVLICSDYRTQIPMVIQAVKDGELEESQLDASLERILQWKMELGIL